MNTRLESGKPEDDTRAFRRALGQFATGVTVVTTKGRDALLYGVTVNSFSSVSLVPPLVQWAVAKSAQSYGEFIAVERFAINVLSLEQLDTANNFARSGGDKFAGVKWSAGLGGVPVLDNVAAAFECVLHQVIDAGDHAIVVGRVERFANHGNEGLLFARGAFGTALQYSSANGNAGPEGVDLEVDHGSSMLGLLWGAFSAFSGRFQHERDAEGLTISQSRVLSFFERHPTVDVLTAAHKLFLSETSVEEAIDALRQAGLLTSSGPTKLSLTPLGLQRVVSLRRRVEEFETARLAHLSADEIRVAKKVLKSLG